MKHKLSKILTTLVALVGVLALPLLFGDITGATPVATQVADSVSEIQDGVSSAGSGPSLQATINNVINIMLFIVGTVAVIMIIIGGIRYVTSGGDSSNTKAAKDTILYAVAGLVLAAAAYGIVNFVVSAI